MFLTKPAIKLRLTPFQFLDPLYFGQIFDHFRKSFVDAQGHENAFAQLKILGSFDGSEDKVDYLSRFSFNPITRNRNGNENHVALPWQIFSVCSQILHTDVKCHARSSGWIKVSHFLDGSRDMSTFLCFCAFYAEPGIPILCN